MIGNKRDMFASLYTKREQGKDGAGVTVSLFSYDICSIDA